MIKEKTLTVAVLPFVNVSGNPKVDEIGRGIADALRHCLQDADTMRVSPTARNSIGNYDIHVRELGRTMRADALLFGCICEANGILRAKVQIVDAMTGQARWSAQVEALAHQSNAGDLAEEIVDRLERAIQLEF